MFPRTGIRANPPGTSWTSSTFFCAVKLVPGAWRFGNAFANGAVSHGDHAEHQGPAFSPEIENIFENSDFVYLLNQASGDRKILCERLNISNQQAAHISNAGPGEGLIFFGNVILPFVDDFPKDNELYSIMTTKLGETGKGGAAHE